MFRCPQATDRLCLFSQSVFFQYRIFPIASFRRIITICGVFLLAFEIASTLVFIFECTPIRDFWVTLSGHLSSKLGGRCIHVKDYLLANGSVNTFTDFALIILVGGITVERYLMLTGTIAVAPALAFASEHTAEVCPDRHLRQWPSGHCRQYGTPSCSSALSWK